MSADLSQYAANLLDQLREQYPEPVFTTVGTLTDRAADELGEQVRVYEAFGRVEIQLVEYT